MRIEMDIKDKIEDFIIKFAQETQIWNGLGKKLVAIPFNKSYIGNMVFFGNQIMRIKTEPLKQIMFPDKFGRGSYTLCYFEWLPEPVW